jgi:putative AlgH/UPF0301 family transcriptional regulator
VLFDTPPEERYTAALGLLGLTAAQLSGLVGHA